MRLLVKNVKELVQVTSKKERYLLSSDISSSFYVLKNVSIAVDTKGIINKIAPLHDILSKHPESEFENVIDASEKCVIPGLVDGHTHPVWSGDRVHEFAMKLKGASYMDIHKVGGGIGFTVNETRKSSEDELLSLFLQRLTSMLKNGTTLVECKSGYGLDLDTEVKMLSVIEKARKCQPVEISSTYCGAHSIPKSSNEKDATEDILNVQIPYLADLCNKGVLNIDNIDVFCEKGVFEVATSRKILEKGKEQNWMINFHAEELNYIGGVEMGVEIGAHAISHLEEISNTGIEMMSKSKTVAVILPTTAHVLRLKHPPVRDMLDKGVIVALGTDFNPNAHCSSMLTVMNLACIMFRMTMEEAITAATINSAASVGKSSTHGSIEEGKVADMLVFDVPSWEHVIYQMGVVENLELVVKSGSIVWKH